MLLGGPLERIAGPNPSWYDMEEKKHIKQKETHLFEKYGWI
jgi:hypothetical protein